MLKKVWLKPICLGAVLAVSMVAAAPAAAPVTVNGTVAIQVALTASKGLPNGTSLYISGSLYAPDPTYGANSSFYPPAVKVAGGKANLNLSIPYKWLVTSRSQQFSVSIYVSGSASEAYDQSSFSKNITFPANGATTTVRFVGAI